MKRVLLLFLVLLFARCSSPRPEPTSTKIPATKTPFQGWYKVTKSTGLYQAPNLDAKMLEDLEVGALLEHANDSETIWCTSFEAEGQKFELCNMEVLNTGRTGWVLRQWFK